MHVLQKKILSLSQEMKHFCVLVKHNRMKVWIHLAPFSNCPVPLLQPSYVFACPGFYCAAEFSQITRTCRCIWTETLGQLALRKDHITPGDEGARTHICGSSDGWGCCPCVWDFNTLLNCEKKKIKISEKPVCRRREGEILKSRRRNKFSLPPVLRHPPQLGRYSPELNLSPCKLNILWRFFSFILKLIEQHVC